MVRGLVLSGVGVSVRYDEGKSPRFGYRTLVSSYV